MLNKLLIFLCLQSIAGYCVHCTQSLTAYFENHDVSITLGSVGKIALLLNGSVPTDVFVNFTSKQASVLQPLADVIIQHDTNESIPLTLVPVAAGHTLLYANASEVQNTSVTAVMLDFKRAYITVSVPHSDALIYFSDVIGWMYFAAWSVSFYPQTYLNFKRKSVIGLNFDFLSLNTLGFICYSFYNVGLYFIPIIKLQYFNHHPYGVNPVQLNDVIFSLHALFACIIQVIQCCIYEKGQQRISLQGRVLLSLITCCCFIAAVLCASSVFEWLKFFYFVSFVKLFITLIKYLPQVYYNHVRRSTIGWSIGNVLLDFTGGTLSILQMFIISYNYNDWGSIFGDFTKFGLGVISIMFDIVFIVQHYYLFKESRGDRQPLYSPVSSYQEYQDSIASDTSSHRNYGATSP